MSMRRLILVVLAASCASVGALTWDVSAWGVVTHRYLSQFNEVPAADGGPLTLVASSMTVDSGHLWIAEPSRVDEFDASTGAFVSQLVKSGGSVSYGESGIAVGHTGGEARVYVGESGESPATAVAVFAESGAPKATWTGADTPEGSFGGSISDVAVDNSTNPLDEDKGYVYVTVPQQRVIDVFRPEVDGAEHYVGRIEGVSPGEPFEFPFKIAVNDVNGDLVVEDGGVFDILEPQTLGTYALVGKIAGTPSVPLRETFNLAVDGANGEIYLTEGFVPVTVDQFSSTGAYLGKFTGTDTPAGEINDVYSLAVDPESQDVYVGDVRGGGEHPSTVDVFGPDLVLPDATTGPVTAPRTTSATLTGTVNPDEAGPATCQFAWGTSTAFGHTAPCSPAGIPNGNSPVAVQATLGEATGSALEPDTTYYYRLQGTDGNGTNPGEASQDQHFTTPGPGMHGQSAADVAATSATLRATIDPHHAPTTYYFQFGISGDYGTDVPVLSESAPHGQALGAGEADVEVTQHLQGLQADTVYHYRVVSISEPAPGEYEEFLGPDRTFTTQAVGGELALADNRVWEMVTPPEKYGADISPISEQNGMTQAAADGDGFTYAANTPVEAAPQGFAGKVQELSTRGPSGWGPVTITVPHTAVTSQPIGYGPEYRFFSSDLSQAAIQPVGVFDPSLSAEASEQTAFLRTTYLHGDVADPCTGSCYRPLATGAAGYANVPPGTVFGGQDESGCLVGCGPNFVGATPDMSHVVLRSSVGLTTGSGGNGGLYEWSAGKLTFIGNGAVGDARSEAVRHSISDDGSHVVIEGQADGLEGLLMRDTATGETVKLDAVQGGSGAGSAAPHFQAASSDGSRVFFTDSQQLTEDAGFGGDLYECEMVREAGALKCRLSDLTPAVPGESAEVEGAVLGVSEDGSWVYFVANGKLGTQTQRGTCASVAPSGGACNLYVLHFDGAKWESPRFIATLSATEDRHDWYESPSGQPTRVSPDGRWLAFMSQAPLTGYDNRDTVTGRPDAEVYLYDASAGRLLCASCDPTGARPVGREYYELEPGSGGLVGGPRGVWETSALVAANLPGWQQTNIVGQVEDYQSRYLFDGGRLLFNSDDALVPQDVNGTEDVYEYEPPGMGSCSTASVTFSERSGGCVGLISSGTSPTESGFLDASENGGDVFFITGEKLVAQDFDTSLDIYDAHECTAQAPCAAAVTSPPPCSTGDACKPAPTPQPASYGSPASATFSGAGNVTLASGGGAAPRSLSRAQKLTRALKACRKGRRRQRATCERRARRQYAAKQSRKANRKKRKRG